MRIRHPAAMIVAAIILWIPMPLVAAVALVASVSIPSPGTSSAIDTSGANLIVVVTTSTTQAGATLYDNKGNLYHPIIRQGTSNYWLQVWVAYDPLVGTGHTWNITANFPSACIAAFSGAHDLFVTAGQAGAEAGSGTSIQPGSVTPPEDNALVVAAIAYRSTNTLSIDSSFTIAQQRPFISGTAVGCGLAYLIQTTAGATNPTWSWTGSAGHSAANLSIGEFVAPTPPGGGTGGSFPFVARLEATP